MKFVYLLLLMVCSSSAQEINTLDDKGLKHGFWKGYYESKRLRYEGEFAHGKENGIFKFFDDTKANTVIATREFNATDNSCYTIFYNQKGFKVSEGKLINKVYEGQWKYYHYDSKELMTSEFYVKGKLDGVRKVYYKNGVLAEETSYKLGKKEGVYKKYAENGIVLEESVYKNDVYHGLAIFKDADDTITAKGVFTNGKKTGIWDYKENGKLVKKNMNLQGKKFQKKKITKDPLE